MFYSMIIYIYVKKLTIIYVQKMNMKNPLNLNFLSGFKQLLIDIEKQENSETSFHQG